VAASDSVFSFDSELLSLHEKRKSTKIVAVNIFHELMVACLIIEMCLKMKRFLLILLRSNYKIKEFLFYYQIKFEIIEIS